jgi:sugar phosphate isomerase/epimerase
MSNIVAAGFSASSRDGEIDSLGEDLERLVAIGADVAELGLTGVDLLAGGRIIGDRLRRLAAMTGRLPLRYSVHGLVSSNFMDPETLPLQLAAAKALVEVCDRIGARILVQHGGELRRERINERARADTRQREALLELAEFARRYDVRIALENIFTTEEGQYRQTPAELAATVREISHPNLVALIDFSHAYIEATYRGLDFRAELAAMAPVTGHLHVHDSFGRPIGRFKPFYPQEATALGLGDLHMPLGWGDIDWETLFAEIDVLPSTFLIMEIEARYRSEQAESLAISRRLIDINSNKAAKAAE